MNGKDTFSDLRRTREAEYFYRKEKELMEKLRQRAKAEAERRQMGEILGVADQEILQDLQELGYSRDTVNLLHLVPLLHVAWIDNALSTREVDQIRQAAEARGIQKGSAALGQLEDWLSHRPTDEFFEKTLRVIRDVLQLLPPEKRRAGTGDLVSCCTQIASASGGLLGLTSKISEPERKLLEQIAAELQQSHQGAAKGVVQTLTES